jgi:hypothetical protein
MLLSILFFDSTSILTYSLKEKLQKAYKQTYKIKPK